MKSQTSSVLSLYLVSILSSTANAIQAYGSQQQQQQQQQQVFGPAASGNAQETELPNGAEPARKGNAQETPGLWRDKLLASDTLRNMVSALDVMQDCYFQLWLANWPSCNDWTAAVMATQVSATLSSLTASPDDILASIVGNGNSDSDNDGHQEAEKTLAFENLIDQFFAHTSAFYFGENAFDIRNEAYDDMLWVVLEWLENIKFQRLHSDLRYNTSRSEDGDTTGRVWHGSQFRVPAAHRARLFYDLAAAGWDTTLCDGGMIWNPKLTPYKNAITNELFIAASIGMYLYFPGDVISSPFVAGSKEEEERHNPVHLQAAIEGYRWLNSSAMTIENGLYGDGFHIAGWQNEQHPGTRRCDVLNTMTYTYNQGVILSGLRGLWLATGSGQYLRDGHNLVQKVIQTTGWDNPSSHGTDAWAGLGRRGVLEDTCDAPGDCSQDGQTFKGIFFHHFTEFCRPLSPEEQRFLAHSHPADLDTDDDWTHMYTQHRVRCRQYRPWIEHNAQAALKTRNEHGQFGMWWGQPYGAQSAAVNDDENNDNNSGNGIISPLPRGAIDYRNHGRQGEYRADLLGATALDSAEDDDDDDDARTRAYGRDHSAREDSQSTRAPDQNNRGRGRTVETQAGGVAVLRALYESYLF